MKSSNFMFGYIDGLLYKCLEVNFNHDESYIDSLKRLKNKKPQ